MHLELHKAETLVVAMNKSDEQYVQDYVCNQQKKVEHTQEESANCFIDGVRSVERSTFFRRLNYDSNHVI